MIRNQAPPDRETELLYQVAFGDENAFQELYETTNRRIYFYIYRMVNNKETAEDLMVETYAQVWRGAGRFRGESRAISWIIGIARNLSRKEFRKIKPDESLENHPNLINGNTPDPDSFDRSRYIQAALAKLPDPHRDVLDLVFFHELTYPEVSAVLDIPVNTVKTRVYHAKSKMEKILRQMGIDQNEL
jgi:RNA polymerase sigma-70 factor (ECF subfamily)